NIAAVSPNFLILETIRDCGGFHAELLNEPHDWRNGRLHLNDRPGLGGQDKRPERAFDASSNHFASDFGWRP
ncbi:MAG: hypothetical protein EBT13_17545, partial [Rhodobacteraceae bacterium]|nr:hypothetical protein [Paracoccaceae bacterium]